MRSLMYLIIAGCLATALSGCAADRAFSTGESLEQEGKFEEAMLSYAEAYRIEPGAFQYRVRFLSAREKAANSRYVKGMEEYTRSNYSAALTNFQVAFGLDPSNERYKQLVDATTRKRDAQQIFREGKEFEKDNKLKFANLAYDRAATLDPETEEYKKSRDRILRKLDTGASGYELNLKSLKPFTFKFMGSGVKSVFRVLTQLSGINFIFDEGVKDQPVTINLERTNFRQVLSLLTTMNKLGASILNEKTVLIYPKTADKIKQYEEMKMRTFHLNYMDAKKGINLIRTMLPARKVYVNEEANSIVVRDSNEVIGVIEKLLDANDIPDAEVLLDVEVLEVNDKNTKNVGLVLSRYAVDMAGFDLNSGLQLADRLSQATSSDTTNAAIDNLVNVFTWNGFGGFVTVPSATYNFGKTFAKGEILSNPKIRVKNKEKAKFTVGTRVPITTTTTNGTATGYSVNVQYVDVGVKLNAEPMIQLNNVIDIKMSLEVSSIVGKEKLGDGLTTVVTIGTRNLETVLSLKDGETSVIGGLIARTNTDSKTKIFLLGDIPLIGPFISGDDTSNEKSELVLAITPHLVRGLMAPVPDVASFMSGKEDAPALGAFPRSADEEPDSDAAPKKTGRASAQRAPLPMAVPQPVALPAQPPLPPTAAPYPGMTTSVTAQPAPAEPVQPVAVQPPAALPVTGQAVIQQPLPMEPPIAPQPNSPDQDATPLPDASMKGGQASMADLQPGAPPVQPPLQENGQAEIPQPLPAAPSVSPAPESPAQQAAPIRESSKEGGQIILSTPNMGMVGEEFTLEIQAVNVNSVAAAPFVLTFDPNLVEPVSFAEGTFLQKNGVKSAFSSSIDAAGGAVTINLSLPAGGSGVSGTGVLATAVFRPKKPGMAAFGFRDVAFVSADGKRMTVTPFANSVGIR